MQAKGAAYTDSSGRKRRGRWIANLQRSLLLHAGGWRSARLHPQDPFSKRRRLPTGREDLPVRCGRRRQVGRR